MSLFEWDSDIMKKYDQLIKNEYKRVLDEVVQEIIQKEIVIPLVESNEFIYFFHHQHNKETMKAKGYQRIN